MNLVNAIVKLTHCRSTDNLGQKTFLAYSPDNKTRNCNIFYMNVYHMHVKHVETHFLVFFSENPFTVKLDGNAWAENNCVLFFSN